MRLVVGQMQRLDPETAAFARQLGIAGVQLNTPEVPDSGGYWSVDDLRALRAGCESEGLKLEALENLPYAFYDAVMLGRDGRDEQLENVKRTIRNVGAAGIPILGYHFMPGFVWRTALHTGRGGAEVTAFDLGEVGDGNLIFDRQAPGDARATLEEMWANYRVFLDAVLPVAESAGVRLALHPDDPPVEQIGDVARLFSSPDRLEAAYALAGGSPAWALNFCLGTVSSMAGGPRAVRRVLDFFGPRRAIAYVHVREVRGTVPAFEECFLGEADLDLPGVLRDLADHGFDGFLLDDHVPAMAGDSRWGHRARAQAIGYVQGILAAQAACAA